MDSRSYIDVATDAQRWLDRSWGLKQSADTLWDRVWETAEAMSEGGSAEINRTHAAHVFSASLLSGYALETALKGRVLRIEPDEVQMSIQIDGDAEVCSADLNVLGVDMSDGHNLTNLASAAEIYSEEVFDDESTWGRFDSLSERLEEVIKWSGRYPIPLSDSNREEWERIVANSEDTDLLNTQSVIHPVLHHIYEKNSVA